MQEANFIFFLGLLRILEKCNSGRDSTETAIINFMDHFERDLSEDQKNAIRNEFLDYDSKRRKKEETEIRKLEKNSQEPEKDFF